MWSRCAKVLCAVALFLFANVSWALAAEDGPRSLTPFVAAPIPGINVGNRPVLADLLPSKGGLPLLLATNSTPIAVLFRATQTGFQALFQLQTDAFDLHVVEGADNALWIGGKRGPTVSIISVPQSYAYLAKVDRGGRVFWKKEFGGQTERSIQSMVPLSSGDVVISGQDGQRSWLARISGDGKIVWEQFVGIGKGSGVTTIGDVVTLVAVDAFGDKQIYREDVVVWSFSLTGQPLGKRVVREGLNHFEGQRAADIRIRSAGDSAYVFSAWVGFEDIKPLAVTKLDNRREPVWIKELPETIQTRKNRKLYCYPSLTVLAEGDVLVGCPIAPDQMTLSRLDATTGNVSQESVQLSGAPPAPLCAELWGPITFLQEKSRESVWVIGSPPFSVEATGCAWIGETVIPAHRS